MSSSAKKKPALGKGLSALLQNANTDITNSTKKTTLVGSISMIALSSIETNTILYKYINYKMSIRFFKSFYLSIS